MASCPITLWEIDQETVETVADFIFLGSKITADGDCNCRSLQMVKLKDAYSCKESYDQPRQPIKKQRHYFDHKCPSSQGYGISSGHVWM